MGSMLDNVTTDNQDGNGEGDQDPNQTFQENSENNNETNSESNDDTPSWFYDKDIAATGDRPEWLNEKYTSAVEQAKGYNELSKKFGGFKGAP